MVMKSVDPLVGPRAAHWAVQKASLSVVALAPLMAAQTVRRKAVLMDALMVALWGQRKAAQSADLKAGMWAVAMVRMMAASTGRHSAAWTVLRLAELMAAW